MKKISQKKLANVFKQMATYVKLADQLCKDEYGEDIRKQASQVTDLLVRNNIISEKDRDRANRSLVMDKKASLKTIEALTNKVVEAKNNINELGSGATKSASTPKMRDSDRFLIENYYTVS